MASERAMRVGERIRAELMSMMLEGQVKDPGVRGAVVHAVKVTNDLRHARVYVRLGEPDPAPARQRALVKGLARASGFLRREIGQRLRLRYTPELAFFWDETPETAARIEAILDDLEEE